MTVEWVGGHIPEAFLYSGPDDEAHFILKFELPDQDAEGLAEVLAEKGFRMTKFPKELPEPAAVETFQGKTYRLYSPVWSYDDARLLANTLPGGRMVTIETSAENEFLLGWVPAGKHYWIGASDETTEGEWTWEGSVAPFWTFAGGASPGAFTAWAEGEPNNANGEGIENCGLLLGGTPGWIDRPCQEKHQLIVETAASEDPKEL